MMQSPVAGGGAGGAGAPGTPAGGGAPAADPFLSDDFYPLESASAAILDALRADEASPDSDLNRRLATGGATSTGTGTGGGGVPGHAYRKAVGPAEQRRLEREQVQAQAQPLLLGNGGTPAGGTTPGGNPQSPANGVGMGIGIGNGTPAAATGAAATPGGASNNGLVPAISPIPGGTPGGAVKLDRPPPTASVVHSRTVPLPPLLAREMSTTRLSSLMGLLPQAGLAWMSVDERLYVWSYDAALRGHGGGSGWGSSGGDGGGGGGGYDDGSAEDFCSYAVPSGQCIVSVGLVRPKKNIFTDAVEWVLVVTTPEEVQLCALAFESTVSESALEGLGTPDRANGGTRSLRLIPTRFSIPTDSIPMLSVCGTDDGRIFLGGHDGCLYEMAYGSPSLASGIGGRPQGAIAVMDDEDSEYLGSQAHLYYGTDEAGMAGLLLSGTKRVLSSVVFGPTADSAPRRPRKCRKLNHTSTGVSGFISSFVPGVILNWFSSSVKAGPIVSMSMDGERSTLYALTSMGHIHAFDLSGSASSTSASASSVGPNPPRLACTVDAPVSARRYLDYVARGKTYPPATSQSSNIANISFPGGGIGAQNGVGGMNGARAILKIADAESQQQQRMDQSRKTSSAPGVASMLHPISISVVRRSESKSLSLMAITGGGLRYYLTTLPLSTSSISGGSTNLKPGKRFTLCHVRAPPPYSATQSGDIKIESGSGGGSMGMMNGSANPMSLSSSSSIVPGVHPSQRAGTRIVAEQGFVGQGTTLLALDASRSDPNASLSGDAIVAMVPDYSGTVGALSSNGQTQSGQISNNPKRAGIAEVVSLPMVESSTSGDNPATLPGGRIWDIAAASPYDSYGSDPDTCLARLFFHSATPTNTELSVGMVPAYFPPSKNPRVDGSRRSVGAHSSLEVASASSNTQSSSGVAASAFAMIYRILLGQQPPRQLQGAPMSVASSGIDKELAYNISKRKGCAGAGFTVHPESRRLGSSRSYSSSSYNRPASGNQRTSTRPVVAAKSSRLSLWLLSPQIAPLSQIVSHHLSVNTASPNKILALNSGGMHCFDNKSILDSLSAVLMKSTSSNMGKDQNIRSFFESYGFSDGCAMCLSLAVFSGSDSLRRRATQAALSFAHVPSMVLPSSDNPSAGIVGLDAGALASGHVFRPSHLYNGLVSLVSRLLRPIWYKPAVVVTEGKTLYRRRQYGGGKRTLPARVELLLDDETLEAIRQPLATLQALLKDVFAPAVDSVPGGKKKHGQDSAGGDAMEVDGNGSSHGNGDQHLITRAMQYQARALPRRQTAGRPVPDEKDLEAKARMTEERNLHSLYRLISRTSQLLTLMSQLHRAQANPSLPEVEWGLLHGLTYCQLVSERGGQDRVETLLTNLVSAGEETLGGGHFDATLASNSAVEADNMSAFLSKSCYLYFSAGSRLTYQGFRAANSALSYNPGTPQRVALSNRASAYFRAAARHWYNPSSVTGRLLRIDVDTGRGSTATAEKEYEKAAKRALDNGSPLARAVAFLMDLHCVGAAVDVCMICASNFGGVRPRYGDEAANEIELIGDNDGYADGVLPWERGLYHRPLNEPSTATSSTSQPVTPGNNPVVSGIEVTNADALRTCYSVLFYHLTELLNAAHQFVDAPALAEEMVSVCSSSSDVRFLRNLYEHLLTSGHVEFLLRIESPTLENWIAHEKKDTFLLAQYYTLHNLDWLSGQVMWKRATTVEEKVPLSERIDCLTRASNAYQSAQSKVTTSSSAGSALIGSILQAGTPQVRQPSVEEISRLQTQTDEQLDIASLQSRLLDSILASDSLVNDVDASKLDALKTSLVPVSDMYNEYAGPLALYDICLLILRTCHENDTDNIVKLWKSILCDYIIPCRVRDPSAQTFLAELKRGSMLEEEDIVLDGSAGPAYASLPLFEDGGWIPKLKDRVLRLGKDLYGQGADYTFPLDLIVRTLEGLRRVHTPSEAPSLTGSTQASWPIHLLIDIGVPYPVILEVYDSLIHRESNGTNDTDAWLRNMRNAVSVLRIWVSRTNRALTGAGQMQFGNGGIGNKEQEDASAQLFRAVSSGGLLNQVDSYKASLEACVSGNGDEIASLISSLVDCENAIRQSFL